MNSSEAMQDKYENVMLLTNEQDINNCDGTRNTTKKVGHCEAPIDITISIANEKLATHPKFAPGETYYLTSKLILYEETVA